MDLEHAHLQQGDDGLDVGVGEAAHHREAADLRRVVAVIGHAHHPLASTEGKDDLGERGSQRDDPPGGPGKLTPFAFQDQGNLLGFDFPSCSKTVKATAVILRGDQ